MKSLFADLTSRMLYLMLGAAVAALFLSWTFSKLDDLFGASQDAATTANSKALLALHQTQVAIRLHLKQTEDRVVADETVLARRATELRDLAEARDAAWRTAEEAYRAGRGPKPEGPPPDAYWKAVADTERIARGKCELGVTACQQRAENAEAELAKYHTQLGEQVKVRHHPCGISLGPGLVATKDGVGVGGGILASCQLVRFPWP